jgi:hypothetical protein
MQIRAGHGGQLDIINKGGLTRRKKRDIVSWTGVEIIRMWLACTAIILAVCACVLKVAGLI